MEIAVHSIKKHKVLQSMNIECKRIEKRNGTELKVFIYEKSDTILEVLNNANIQQHN